MDVANKEEALRARDLGMHAAEKGDREKALRMLKKSYAMYSSPQTQALIDKLSSSQAQESSSQSPKKQEPAMSTQERDTEGAEDTGPRYTQADTENAKKILKCKGYYEVLQVEKECSAAEIRRAYRKLALKVHPDKNQAPGAAEAFKRCAQAFACLSDEAKRRQYDQYGFDIDDKQSVPDHHRQSPQSAGYYTRMPNGFRVFRTTGGGDPFADPFGAFFGGSSAFDPFNVFRSEFGGIDPFGAGRVRYRPRASGAQGGNRRSLMWLQVPIYLFIILYAFNFLASHNSKPKVPEFVFTKDSLHVREFSAAHPYDSSKKISYFVKTDFERVYPMMRDRRLFERRVLTVYKTQLLQRCQEEKQQRATMINRARRYYSGGAQADMLHMAESKRLYSCEEMKGAA